MFIGFKCCSSWNNEIVFTDDYGDWGVEDNDWCGIIKTTEEVNIYMYC